MAEPDSVQELARLAREAARMRWGPEDTGAAPTLPGKEKSSGEPDSDALSGDEEREVLKALDPFWTRGIVKPKDSEE